MVGQLELAFRIAVTAVAIVTPALLFQGMWRGLDLLRDDALVARVQERGGLDTSSGTPGYVVPGVPDGASGSTIRCGSCGASNGADATYCRQCLERLPG